MRTSVVLRHVDARRGAGGCRTPAARAAPKFYRDDPIWRDPETQDASGAGRSRSATSSTFVENSFLGAGDRTPTRAVNVNTVDEVPDSSWFTNRAGTARLVARPMRSEGPTRAPGPPPAAGRSSRAKIEGHHARADDPGQRRATSTSSSSIRPRTRRWRAAPRSSRRSSFTRSATTCRRTTWPRCAARRSSSRPAPRSRTRTAASATMRPARRRRGPARRPRATPMAPTASSASKALPGRSLGPFRYYGTRPDDPNDIFPHEHRRELRGLSVFAAWLNHDESRSANSLDTLVPRREPADRPPPPARLRLDARQRQHEGAEPARRQRVRLGIAADAHHDADARLLRAAVDQGRLPRHPGGRAVRGELLPAAGVEAGLPQPGVSRTRGPKTASGPRASSRRFRTTRSARSSATRAVLRSARHRSTSPRRCWRGRARC